MAEMASKLSHRDFPILTVRKSADCTGTAMRHRNKRIMVMRGIPGCLDPCSGDNWT